MNLEIILKKWNKYINIIEKVFSKESTLISIEESISLLFKSRIPWTWAIIARKSYHFSGGLKEEPLYVATLLAAINTKLPEIILKIIQYSSFMLKIAFKNKDKEEIKRGVLFLVACYRQKIIDINFIKSIIIKLLEEEQSYLQLLISIMWLIAPLLQEDNKTFLSLVFQSLHRFSETSFGQQIYNLTKWRREKWVSYTGKDRHTYSRIPMRYNIIEEQYLETLEIDFDEIEEIDNTLNYLQPYDIENFFNFNLNFKKLLFELENQEEEEEVDEEEEKKKNKTEINKIEENNDTKNVINKMLEDKEIQELNRKIYLTIVSSGTSSEAAHRLAKMGENEENEKNWPYIIKMCIDYIGMEKTYDRNNSILIQMLLRLYSTNLLTTENYFLTIYTDCYKYESRRILNLANLYSYLLSNDFISWRILGAIRLTEIDTNSSQRIFIRHLWEELSKEMSHPKIIKKLNEPEIIEFTKNIFLIDNLENAEFVVEFFNIINLGFLCDKIKIEITKMYLEKSNNNQINNIEKKKKRKKKNKL